MAACAICRTDAGIVLLRRGIDPQKGLWVFPGGFVDRGEAVSDAAVRETLEEVGLRVSLTGILDAYSTPGSAVVVVVYAAEVGRHAEARREPPRCARSAGGAAPGTSWRSRARLPRDHLKRF